MSRWRQLSVGTSSSHKLEQQKKCKYVCLDVRCAPSVSIIHHHCIISEALFVILFMTGHLLYYFRNVCVHIEEVHLVMYLCRQRPSVTFWPSAAILSVCTGHYPNLTLTPTFCCIQYCVTYSMYDNTPHM